MPGSMLRRLLVPGVVLVLPGPGQARGWWIGLSGSITNRSAVCVPAVRLWAAEPLTRCPWGQALCSWSGSWVLPGPAPILRAPGCCALGHNRTRSLFSPGARAGPAVAARAFLFSCGGGISLLAFPPSRGF